MSYVEGRGVDSEVEVKKKKHSNNSNDGRSDRAAVDDTVARARTRVCVRAYTRACVCVDET